MNHPTELLPDYALGELMPEEAHLVETHLARCPTCRAKLRELQEGLVKLAESVPEARAPRGSWENIQARLAQRSTGEVTPKPPLRGFWQPWLVAASLLIAASGLWWGVEQQQGYAQLRGEQRKVAGWLSRSDVVTRQLLDEQGERLGSVLTLSDGRALFVLREPPPAGSSYQAWGQRDGERVPLGVSDSSLLEVPYTGFDFIGLSLEGGSSQPSRPLGRVPTS